MQAVTHPASAATGAAVRRGPTDARRLLRSALLWLAACIAVPLGLSACSDGGSVAEPSAAASVTAVIDAAGGTLTGPDGVQVVVPAGALSQATTLGIARSSVGAPAALPEDYTTTRATYEFTPHDLVFHTPVTIRMPASGSTPSAEILMASPGGGWQVYDATVSGGFAEWQRNSFSWGMGPFACAPSNSAPYSAGNPDPFPCSQPRGAATVSATPAAAITQRTFPHPFGSAGSWVVHQATTVQLTLNYQAAPDCQNPRAKLIRWDPAAPLATPNRVTTLFDGPVALTPTTFPVSGGGTFVRGTGSTTLPISFSHLDNMTLGSNGNQGTHAFGFTFSCNRPSRAAQTGGDLLTFIAAVPVPSVTHSIGGTVSGLTGTGLVLQNNGSNATAVGANGSFTFATRIGAGAPYAVTVRTQPAGQTCTVTNGTGTANAVVTNVAVSCAAAPNPLVTGVLSARAGHSCALKPDGSVVCWGLNTSFQLGDGTSLNKSSPVPVAGLSGLVAVAASTFHSCAIKADASAVCWGANDAGQLGDGSGLTQPAPVAVSGLSGVKSLSGGRDHTCALKTDGSVVCWGNNTFGQLGDGTAVARPTPVAVSGLAGVVAISAGWDFTCAAKADGSVACWGRNDSSQLGDGTTVNKSAPVAVTGLTGGTGVSTGQFHACAPKADGSVACWGENSEGQLGDGSFVNKSTFVAVSSLSGVVAMSTGSAHNCALKSDGGVACWGGNSRGQIGDGTTGTAANKTTPVAVSGLSGVTAVTTGSAYSCALKTDGSAACWGWNIDGALGDASFVDRPVPTAVVGGAVFWK